MEHSLIKIFAQNLKTSGKRPRTIEGYCNHVSAAEKFVQSRFGIAFTTDDADKVNGQMLKDWLVTLDRYSENTRLIIFASLRSFIRDMISSGFFPAAMDEAVPKLRKRPAADDVVDEDDVDEGDELPKEYTPEQVVALINHAGKRPANLIRDQAVIALLFGTGLRCFEVCSLTVGTFRKMKDGSIKVVRKGGVLKKVEVADFAIPYIETYLKTRGKCEDNEPLFLNRTGGALTTEGLRWLLKRKQQALGLRTGVHNTRHTFLSDIGRRTNPIIARDAAGHSSVAITNTYLHNTSKDLHDAVNESPWAMVLQKNN